MTTLVIDRSTAKTTVVLAEEGGAPRAAELGIWSTSGSAAPLDGDALRGVGRIIVGTGPGSFAGIRSSLAFAMGVAIGLRGLTEVLGIPSPAAFAREGRRIAVVGDARRGKFWLALFNGFSPEREIFQVERDGLLAAVPGDASVVSPDFARIGGILAETFGERASAAPTLDAAWLHRAALANPSLLSTEPLPVYLNPAVRT